MNPASITKLSEFRFQVQYPGEEPLNVDFEPLFWAAQALLRCDRMVLKHWQGKPKGQRRFGLFAWEKGTGSYSCHHEPTLCGAMHYDLQVADVGLPTAALYYPGARAEGARVV